MATERSMQQTPSASARKPARAWARAALASACWFAWAGACGGKSDSVPVVGSESHFLMRCTDSCDSEQLACIGGICTQSCIIGEDACSELASAARCTDQSVEPGNVAVCDVSCSNRDDCAALGDGHVCDGGFCRLGALGGAPLDAACEEFRDQTSPPVVRGINLVNTGISTLYLQPYRPPCALQSSFVRVYQLESGSTPRELNLHGMVCAPQCGNVIDSGWPYDGEGSFDNDCPGATCAGGSGPPFALQPGASLFEAARTETVWTRLPRGCASNITTDAVNCIQRVLPPALVSDPAGGTYRFVVSASLTPECGEGCEPLVFQFEDPSYFYGDQAFEISADDDPP
jgi:hypothetical protein